MGTEMIGRCVIIGSCVGHLAGPLVHLREDDFVICADGGLRYAQRFGIRPQLVLGDFDSYDGELPQGVEVLRAPVEKDDTDMGLAIRYALEHGAQELLLVGGLGGRLDMTLANVQLAVAAARQGAFVLLCDEHDLMTVLVDGRAQLPRVEGYRFSLLSFTERCEGVSVHGAHYPLDGVTLTSEFPLGVSNEFEADTVTIEVQRGVLLICLTHDAR